MNNQQRVLAELQQRDGQSLGSLAKRLELTMFEVNPALYELRRTGLVIERNGRWFVTDDGSDNVA